MNNQAFIDGQNLTLSTTLSLDPWKVDLFRFRVYLREKYNVEEAYYFLGFMDEKYEKLYQRLSDAGFILVFRAHGDDFKSRKKGNVDTDIVFMMMKNFHERNDSKKFFLVSGDGDYYKTILYLKNKGVLGKILFPAHFRASSLYRDIGGSFYTYLDDPSIKEKIELKNEGFA